MIEERLLNRYERSNLFFEGIDRKHIDYYAYNKYLRENSLRSSQNHYTSRITTYTCEFAYGARHKY